MSLAPNKALKEGKTCSIDVTSLGVCDGECRNKPGKSMSLCSASRAERAGEVRKQIGAGLRGFIHSVSISQALTRPGPVLNVGRGTRIIDISKLSEVQGTNRGVTM